MNAAEADMERKALAPFNPTARATMMRDAATIAKRGIWRSIEWKDQDTCPSPRTCPRAMTLSPGSRSEAHPERSTPMEMGSAPFTLICASPQNTSESVHFSHSASSTERMVPFTYSASPLGRLLEPLGHITIINGMTNASNAPATATDMALSRLIAITLILIDGLYALRLAYLRVLHIVIFAHCDAPIKLKKT